jgi:hypothetical protein
MNTNLGEKHYNFCVLGGAYGRYRVKTGLSFHELWPSNHQTHKKLGIKRENLDCTRHQDSLYLIFNRRGAGPLYRGIFVILKDRLLSGSSQLERILVPANKGGEEIHITQMKKYRKHTALQCAIFRFPHTKSSHVALKKIWCVLVNLTSKNRNLKLMQREKSPSKIPTSPPGHPKKYITLTDISKAWGKSTNKYKRVHFSYNEVQNISN